MTTLFFTAKEIAEAQGEKPLAIYRLAEKQGWNKQAGGKARKRPGRGGGWEYHVSLLPDIARARLTIGVTAEEVKVKSSELWASYERLSKDRKHACERRLKVVDAVDDLMQGGMSETASITYVSGRWMLLHALFDLGAKRSPMWIGLIVCLRWRTITNRQHSLLTVIQMHGRSSRAIISALKNLPSRPAIVG